MKIKIILVLLLLMSIEFLFATPVDVFFNREYKTKIMLNGVEPDSFIKISNKGVPTPNYVDLSPQNVWGIYLNNELIYSAEIGDYGIQTLSMNQSTNARFTTVYSNDGSEWKLDIWFWETGYLIKLRKSKGSNFNATCEVTASSAYWN